MIGSLLDRSEPANTSPRLTSGKRILEIRGYDYAVVGGDSEQGEEADPDGDAEIDRMNLEQLSQARSEHGHVEEPRLCVEPDHDEPA